MTTKLHEVSAHFMAGFEEQFAPGPENDAEFIPPVTPSDRYMVAIQWLLQASGIENDYVRDRTLPRAIAYEQEMRALYEQSRLE